MAARVFFDTNVFVYAFDPRAPKKQTKARALIRQAIESSNGVVSYQVVQEFLNVMTSRFHAPPSAQDLRTYLFSELWPMCEILPSPSLYATALTIRESTGYGFYDSLIVGAALQAECEVLYSEDLQAGRMLGDLEIRNPFA